MEKFTLGKFSFTYTIPDVKYIYFKERIQYGKLTNEQQYDFLENQLQKINKFKDIRWVYEQNTLHNTNLHIHGYVIGTTHEEMENFRHLFYSHPITITPKSYFKLSDIQKTTHEIEYFIRYCAKHQDTIKYYMRVLEDQKLFNSLDSKSFNIKIEVNGQREDTGRPQSPIITANSYDFGKNKKFILQL